MIFICLAPQYKIVISRDVATLCFWGRWLSMSYKTERGNVAQKSLRFHATAKIILDYQPVTKHTVAASR